eukprot:6202652-Pleurochrysis_carterae.AAC.2
MARQSPARDSNDDCKFGIQLVGKASACSGEAGQAPAAPPRISAGVNGSQAVHGSAASISSAMTLTARNRAAIAIACRKGRAVRSRACFVTYTCCFMLKNDPLAPTSKCKFGVGQMLSI